jgi:hypothetical protein
VERLVVKGRCKGERSGLKCHYLIGTQSLTKLNITKGSICRGFDHVNHLALVEISTYLGTCINLNFEKEELQDFPY